MENWINKKSYPKYSRMSRAKSFVKRYWKDLYLQLFVSALKNILEINIPSLRPKEKFEHNLFSLMISLLIAKKAC